MKTKQRFSGNLAITFPTVFAYENQVRGKIIKYCCHKKKLLPYFDRGFIDEIEK